MSVTLLLHMYVNFLTSTSVLGTKSLIRHEIFTRERARGGMSCRRRDGPPLVTGKTLLVEGRKKYQ